MTTRNAKRHAERLRERYHTDPEYQEAHKQRVKVNRAQYREANKQLLAGFKSTGCLLCGETASCCLSAHHVDPKAKTLNVAQAVSSVTPARFKAELALCVCLCENCHRKVHAGLLALPL